jgi:diguanylate cyclase (GGDEF)-like protein
MRTSAGRPSKVEGSVGRADEVGMDRQDSWLCTSATRERLLEMSERMRPVRAVAFGLMALALVACGPWLGWWTIFPLAWAIIGFVAADSAMQRMARPEYAYALAWANAQAMIAISAVLTGGPDSPVVAWLAIPVVSLAARFTTRGIVAGVGLTLLLIAAATVGFDPAAVADAPQLAIFPAVLVISVAVLGIGLMQSDLDHRASSVIDPLTQMLNRSALDSRVHEIEQQSAITGEPVALIVGDIDNFKAVNDAYGHTVGDAVLTDLAYELRKALRAFDLVYRLGGEEFLVVLPGAMCDDAADLAERMRASIDARAIGGLEVTMSFGVASSRPGTPFDYETVFERADAALYEAKSAGRNRVAADADLPLVAA